MVRTIRLIIAGEEVGSGSHQDIPVLNPATEEIVAYAPIATEEDLSRAADSAQNAMSRWSKTSNIERRRLLLDVASWLRANRDRVSRELTLEQGKPLSQATAEVDGAASYFEWFAEEARRLYGRTGAIDFDQALTYRFDYYARGPVFCSVPWNFPIAEPAAHIAAAVAAGASIIVKANEETPSGAYSLGKAILECGAPEGLVNIVTGDPAKISEYLINDSRILRVAFTGSTQVGRLIAGMAGQALKACTLELGGNAPTIVCESADIGLAVDEILARKFRNAGQVCVAPNRIFIHSAIYEHTLSEITAKVASYRLGNGLSEGVDIGPLANRRRLDAQEQLVRNAVSMGAEVHSGGKRMGNVGFFWEPTILTNVSDGADVFSSEIFGTTLPLYTFDSLPDVISRSNSVPYGLAAYGFTTNEYEARQLSDELAAGIVGINTTRTTSHGVPAGGIRDSGWGVIAGSEGLAECCYRKLVVERRPL